MHDLPVGLLTLAAAVLALPALGMLYQYVGERRDRRRFPPPGRLIPVGGYRLHLLVRGEGAPTVVFDSALASTSVSWTLVQRAVSRFATACCYDRAGSGWSDPVPGPRDAQQHARELHSLLQAARLPPPYLLVGHSYGALTAWRFAEQFRDQTAGLVLLDPADPSQWADPKPEDRRKITGGARLSRRGVWVARLGLARLVIWLGGSGAMNAARKLASGLSLGMPRRVQDRLLSPLDKLPSESRGPLKWFWTRPEFYRTLAQQIEAVPHSARLLDNTAGALGDLPLVVVSAPNSEPSWLPRQRELAKLSSRGVHRVAQGSSHWIPLDRPDLVVEVIREMLEELRAGTRTPQDAGTGAPRSQPGS